MHSSVFSFQICLADYSAPEASVGSIASRCLFERAAEKHLKLRPALTISILFNSWPWRFKPLQTAPNIILLNALLPQVLSVLGHHVKNFRDVLKIGWLPINKGRDLNLLKSCFKALHNTETWPGYLEIIKQECRKELR